mmetsp:Transcript_29427/g.82976  ORF Transcript_29427/g.82976 Transcript_29427/m.82976 type:complete len:443 (+) Transcript_29427:148-1476(+)|eukprot:CAMPEP_0117682792 /NCGR_PEP_ID=MMETSP0804-20121206/19917_1 /TAXON_ID=1074897 /ORGANISM="Tetraselmis astigmatica, Strain CCMP880" /LENGTH=442 /DNA_ID=CAMNT_0005493065 /DNA_START=72 /DNA_END=1400 /DNA_ORIENTATION=+
MAARAVGGTAGACRQSLPAKHLNQVLTRLSASGFIHRIPLRADSAKDRRNRTLSNSVSVGAARPSEPLDGRSLDVLQQPQGSDAELVSKPQVSGSVSSAYLPQEAVVRAEGDKGEAPARAADNRTKEDLWKAAIKLPMYSVAVVPVMVGAAAAFMETGVFPGLQFSGIMAASLLIILWLNLSNDAFDSDTNVDVAKAESVVNLLGGRRGLVLAGANAALFAGVAVMGCSIAMAGDVRVPLWLSIAVACGYVYQGPPFRLSYKGLGEPLCFAAFGPLATGAFYLAHAGTGAATAAAGAGTAAVTIGPALWACSVVVGITTTAILFCSHFHQIEGDLAAGKMSPLVRLGPERASRVLNGAVAVPYMMLAVGTALGILPWPLAIASFASMPWAMELIDYVEANHAVPSVIRYCKLYAIKWHCAMGLCLSLGFVALGLVPDIPWLP